MERKPKQMGKQRTLAMRLRGVVHDVTMSGVGGGGDDNVDAFHHFPFRFTERMDEVHPSIKTREGWKKLSDHLITEVETRKICVGSIPSPSSDFPKRGPHRLVESDGRILLTSRLLPAKETDSVFIFRASIDGHPCVAKVMEIYIDDYEAETHWSPESGERTRVPKEWMESLGWQKVYPSRFYGSTFFYSPSPTNMWYSIVFMPEYVSTFNTLLDKMAKPSQCTPAVFQEVTDAMMQILFHTIPKAKKSHLVAHNDLKLNNLAWRPTTKRYVWVSLVGGPTLRIPTHGKLFYLIDFGWCSIRCRREGLSVASWDPIDALDLPMNMWNPVTDVGQYAHSVRWYTCDYLKRVPNPKLQGLLEMMLEGDGGDITSSLRRDWVGGFYSRMSVKYRFTACSDVIDIAEVLYGVKGEAPPQGRSLLEYDPYRVLCYVSAA